MRALLVASGLGLAQAAWAAFQWYELLVARRGGEVVCGIGGGGHCAEVWDSPFASSVHAATGLPVAAWGVAFGLVACALPLVARIRLARRRAAESWLGGSFVAAIAGVVGAGTLLAASLRFGHLCQTCGGSYLLALAYAAAVGWAIGLPKPGAIARGAPLAAALLGVAFLALYVPGRRTPQNPMASGIQTSGPAPASGVGSTPEEREISAFIQSIPPEARQLLSDTLAAYAASAEVEPPPPRTVIGTSANPRLRLTEWTDTLCGHCKQLHETLVQLRQRFGPDAFTVAPHQYPLDPSCNPNIKLEDSQPLRCLAARVQICAEGKPAEFDFVGKLFDYQGSLTEPMLWDLAEPLGARADLEACVRSPETEKKLQDDIAWAAGQGITGTPLLFVGRRQAIAYPPLLYVLALNRGAPSNPAFAVLPPPQPLPWATGKH